MCASVLLPTKSLRSAAFNPATAISIRKCKARCRCRAQISLPEHGMVDRLAELHARRVVGPLNATEKLICADPRFLREAYERCRIICAHNASIFYLAWGTRMDELTDGPNAHYTSSDELEKWDERLEDIFNGCPYDILDAALADTAHKFSLDIKPFQDLLDGMKMDKSKTRYENFQELQLYCYYVSGAMSLVCVRVLGISSEASITAYQSIYKAALNLAIGNQLINILRDVAEDYVLRGRIYLPQDELEEFGLSDEDIMSRKVTEQWRKFMRKQIARARMYCKQAEEAASPLDSTSKWAVWASLMLYEKILDKIEGNNYDNLTKRASVGKLEKLLTLPLAYAKAKGL